MKTHQNAMRRGLSLLLGILMICTALPFATFASLVVPVTGVSLPSTSITMTVGDIRVLPPNISPSDATDKSVQWVSSNGAIASVNSAGQITANAVGSAVITVLTNDGNKTASCTVNVQSAAPASYNIQLTAGTGGTVKGGGSVAVDKNTTVTATPNSGYVFSGWYEGNKLVSSSRSYTFKATSDRSLTARFTRGTSSNTFRITATAGEGGTVSGGGVYALNSTATVEATPKTGYIFTGWYEGTSKVSSNESYSFRVSKARTLTARFSDGTFTVSLSATTGGRVYGSGTYDDNERVTVEAVPNSGYNFDGWYEDNTKISSLREYSFRISDHRTLQGRFVKQGSTTTTTTTASTLSVSDAKKAGKTAASDAKKAGKKTATVKLRGIGNVSLDALKAMRKEAGMAVKFQADTMTSTGKSVDTRITIDPSKATKGVNLSASRTNAESQKTRTFFAKWFKNKTHVLAFGQSGTFGCDVEIAVKLDFTGMNKNNLYFYTYNSSKNTYKRIYPTKSWVDSNSYLHVVTNNASNIIVSDGKLVRK